MRVIKATIPMLESRTLVIGFQAENQRTQVRIDCAPIFAEYPHATPSLAIKPPSGETYPVFVERDGNEVVWDIVANNLAMKGDGELQLTFYKDNVIAKTSVGHITVNRSLQIDGEMPDVVATWIENANRKLAEVDAQIVELEGMVDTATDAATRAEQSASTASTKAEQAAGSAATATEKATEATQAAGTATAKAAEAQTAAQTATNKANAAAESERIATAKAGDATTAAGTATAKAEQATEAAQTATGKAEEASASATAAQTSATNAASSATAAQASQTAAKASETAAGTSATQAAQSAQTANTASQTATQKAAEATQSATDAAIFAGTATTKAEEAAESAQAASDAQTAVEQTAEQLADSLEQIDQNTQDIAELEERKANIDGYYPDMTVGNAEQLNSSKYVENSEPYTLRTSGGTSDIGNREYLDAVVGGTVAWNQEVRDEASENSTDFADVVTVTDAVEDAAGVKVKIEPVQDLHGYDHPWPAGGGKNLLDSQIETSGYIRGTDGAFVSGVDAWKCSTDYSPILPNTNYILYKYETATSSVAGYAIYDENKNYIDGNAYSSGATISITTPQNARYIRASWGRNASTPVALMLASETDATFAPYSNICPITGWDGVQIVVSPTTDAEDGQTYDITLPTEAGTVYGGELTVNADGSGSLVVDRASVVLNGNELRYELSTHNRWIVRVYNTDTMLYVRESNANLLSNEFVVISQSSSGGSNTAIYINDTRSFGIQNVPGNPTTSAELQAWLANNPVQAVYRLATPITYTLTASQIRTLLGTNNVWSDAGQTALTYTGTDEHLTLESGKKYLARISGTDSMLLGSGQEITAAKGTDNVFDLTKMFGTAVADYVYGQGAAFFRKWFGKQWYPYNAGELLSVEGLQSHDMVGFNQWDEEWEIGAYGSIDGNKVALRDRIRSKNEIQVLPETMYAGNIGLQLYYYDANHKFLTWTTISNGKFRTPTDAKYMTFNERSNSGTTYHHNICINLAHNNSRNGEYEPYEKHSYPLDSTVVLRGIPKVGANGVYWDGDRYLPDGTVERKYGVVEITSPMVSLVQNYSNVVYAKISKPTDSADKSKATSKCVHGMFATNAATSNWDDASKVQQLFGGADYQNYWFGFPIGTTLEQAKSVLVGTELIYELATPTTETAQPYHSTQWVSDWGTEEFVSTGIVPVGTETRYPANLRDKLQHLPDAASGNGSYLIQQTDGQMILTPFPAPPSSAGNYVLKATVTNGVATYTWEVAT